MIQILTAPLHRQRRHRRTAASSRASSFPPDTTSRRALYSVRLCLIDSSSRPIAIFFTHTIGSLCGEFATDKYHPIELSLDIPMDEKIVAMIEWWSSAHELFLKYGTWAFICISPGLYMCASLASSFTLCFLFSLGCVRNRYDPSAHCE
jgi:hypothetical protein